MSNKLPKEFVSLIHHVELNRAKWWDKAVQQLICASLWFDQPATVDSIKKVIKDNFFVDLNPIIVRKAVKNMMDSNVLVALPDGRIKLSESVKFQLEKDIEEIEKIESAVKEKFASVAKIHCPYLDIEKLWDQFNAIILLSLLRDMGANTFRLLIGENLNFNWASYIDKFLKLYPPEFRPSLQRIVETFFNFTEPAIRAYMLRMLNAYLTIEASGVSKETLQALMKYYEKKPTFYIFVDTNFLFSILELHENPSNEAAISLVELINEVKSIVDVRLYVLPPTLEEAKRVLVAVADSFRGVKVTPNIAKVALEERVSGIAAKFFDAVVQRGPLDAKTFFGPYIDDLLTIARKKGVELFNERVEGYKTRQDVIDDIMTVWEFEKEKYGARAKTYEQIEHDMILWHFVKDKRAPFVDSPIDAKYWIVTIDYRFLGFDGYKRKLGSPEETIPICVHPAMLVQMLQFWIPRTPKFEAAILSSIRLPFVFKEFDVETEKIIIKIITTLSRYEGVEDLPLETIQSILLNQALRERMKEAVDLNEEVEAIKETLIEELEKLKQKEEKWKQEVECVKQQIAGKERTIEKLQSVLSEERQKRKNLETQLVQMQDELQKLREELRKKKQRSIIIKFLSLWCIIPLLVAAVLDFIITKFAFSSLQSLRFQIGIWSALLFIWMIFISYKGRRDPVIATWHIFKAFDEIRKWLWKALIAGFLVNALWDVIKNKLL